MAFLVRVSSSLTTRASGSGLRGGSESLSDSAARGDAGSLFNGDLDLDRDAGRGGRVDDCIGSLPGSCLMPVIGDAVDSVTGGRGVC